jgi:protease YdgD
MDGAALRRLALLAAFCVAMPNPADGGAHDALQWRDGPFRSTIHRSDVDMSRHPWSAIGALFNESGAACTGVIVARDKVLTAAHCVYNARTRRFAQAASLHFLAGYRGSGARAPARVAHYEIGAGFDPLQYRETYNADWVLLTLRDALPAAIVPLRLAAEDQPSGTRAAIAGYPEHRRHALTADRDCELRERIGGGRLILHSCRGVRGYSGAPILVGAGDAVRVAGIHVASLQGGGAERMVAVPARAILRQAASLGGLSDVAAGERVPVVGRQDHVGAPGDVGERAPHLFEVVVDARRDRLADVEVDLAGDVADDRRGATFGFDEDALVTGGVGVVVEHAGDAGERLAVSLDQIQAVP